MFPPLAEQSGCGCGQPARIGEESANGKNRWAIIRLRDSLWQYLKRQLDCLNNEAFVALLRFLPGSSFFPNTFRAPCEITVDVRAKEVFPCGITAEWSWWKRRADRCWQKAMDNTCLKVLKKSSHAEHSPLCVQMKFKSYTSAWAHSSHPEPLKAFLHTRV